MNGHNIILPDQFSPEETQAAGVSHNVQDKWVRGRLYHWFTREAHGNCWVCIQHEDGRWYYWSKGSKMEPPARKRNYARKVVAYLNRHCHFDGVWVGAWLDDGWTRFYLLWKDEGGDIQIPMDTAGGLAWEGTRGYSHWGPDVWGNHCTNAHALWMDAKEAVGAKADQQISLAKGG